MKISRIDRIPTSIALTALNADGTTATIAAVSVALLPLAQTPTAATVWTTVPYAAGSATLIIAGPDATAQGGDFIATDDMKVWCKDSNSDHTQAVEVGRVSVQ